MKSKILVSGHIEEVGAQAILSGDVAGKALGIVGPGRIGKAVAESARGF